MEAAEAVWLESSSLPLTFPRLVIAVATTFDFLSQAKYFQMSVRMILNFLAPR